MNKILFVCTGNSCRSPMAMFLFKKFAKENNLTIKADSAGLNVLPGDKINEKAVLSLKNFNIKRIKYYSKQLTKNLFEEASMVITMTDEQKYMLPKNKKVFSFFDIIGKDISDPFGLNQDCYNECAKQLNNGLNSIYNAYINLIKSK